MLCYDLIIVNNLRVIFSCALRSRRLRGNQSYQTIFIELSLIMYLFFLFYNYQTMFCNIINDSDELAFGNWIVNTDLKILMNKITCSLLYSFPYGHILFNTIRCTLLFLIFIVTHIFSHYEGVIRF